MIRSSSVKDVELRFFLSSFLIAGHHLIKVVAARLALHWLYPGSDRMNFTVNALLAGDLEITHGASGNPIDPVPLPAALPLFATGLVGLGLLGWRRKKKAAA